ncbi:nucleotidyltransferase domain-containing protein [Clostridium sp. 1001271B_151109_B4]|uniref:nucleotidyltransferase family protein n=1 Tax=Clostridium sp. 1001271B_151109_B4 TaxID=2787148 RepID=UPI0018AA3F27|nr:nucleotidyltransferase domain-containing protein [Clostridium sp. 1001271B_151109_B4]
MSKLLSKEEILTVLHSDKIKKLFTTYNIKSLISFGSINTDEFSEVSDIDLAVISDIKLPLDNILTLELTLQSLLNREIDIIDLNSDSLDLFIKINILNTGSLIYTVDNNITLNAFYNSVDKLYNENKNFIYFRRLDVLS